METKNYIEKYKELKSQGFFDTLRSEVFWLVKFTNARRIDDIQKLIGHKHSTIAARLSELADAGVIEPDYVLDGQTVYKVTSSGYRDLLRDIRQVESDIRLIKKLLLSPYVYGELEHNLKQKLEFLKAKLKIDNKLKNNLKN